MLLCIYPELVNPVIVTNSIKCWFHASSTWTLYSSKCQRLLKEEQRVDRTRGNRFTIALLLFGWERINKGEVINRAVGCTCSNTETEHPYSNRKSTEHIFSVPMLLGLFFVTSTSLPVSTNPSPSALFSLSAFSLSPCSPPSVSHLTGAHGAPIAVQHPDLPTVLNLVVMDTVAGAVVPVGAPAVVASVQVEAHCVVGTGVPPRLAFINVCGGRRRRWHHTYARHK